MQTRIAHVNTFSKNNKYSKIKCSDLDYDKIPKYPFFVFKLKEIEKYFIKKPTKCKNRQYLQKSTKSQVKAKLAKFLNIFNLNTKTVTNNFLT